MKELDANFEKIENYLFGLMDAAERDAFEREVAADPALAAELKIQQAEHRAMELLLQQDLRANMAQWKSERSETLETAAAKPGGGGMRVSFSRSQFFRLAAAACVLLVAGMLWWMQQGGASPEDLYSETVGLSRSKGGGDTPAGLQSALDAMRKKDFAAALAALDQASDPTFVETSALLKSECLFHLGRYDEAAAALQPLLQSPVNAEKAEWQLLLTYWKKGDKTRAKQLLDKILSEPEHAFYGKAGEVRM